jgi:hypothetical protein
MRLATDLGLHLKAASYQKDAQLRKLVFWGAYIHDR